MTVTLGPRDGAGFRLLLTVVHERTASLDTRALVSEQGRKLLPTALETSLKVEQLRGDAGVGHYHALTDRKPRPGEFEHLVQGVMTYGELRVSFTLLTHRANSWCGRTRSGLAWGRGFRPTCCTTPAPRTC
jgi:hypothetical protein